MPYSSMPTKITGYYKYTASGSDEGLLLIIFKKGGKQLSLDTFRLKAASAYTYFEFNLSLSSTPDTMVFGASNSFTALNNKPSGAGSTLFLDDLAFTGSGTMPAIPDGDFENWTTASYDVLNSWNSYSGDNISRTTDKYKGNYAARLQTASNGNGSSYAATIFNGKNVSGPHSNGLPDTMRNDTLVFYYKYTSVGNDSAAVDVELNGPGGHWSSQQNLPAQSAYTKVIIPINPGFKPDSLYIAFTSSKWSPSGGKAGSTFIIDEVQLTSAPLFTGIAEFKNPFASLRLYPNPAGKSTRIFPSGDLNKNSELMIYNSSAQLILSMKLKESSYPNGIEIKLDGWKPGMYFYHLYSSGSTNEGNFIKE